MAYPAAYTEQSLAEYMHATLGAMATRLGWTVDDGHYTEAVNEAVAAYGTDDVEGISGRDNLRTLRALARREVWRLVLQSLAAYYEFSTDGQSFKPNQMSEQAQAALLQAEAECAALGIDDGAYSVSIDSVIYPGDPYSYLPDSVRTRPT